MASPLTPLEVAHIADLARLELSPTEQEALARQLTDILAYAGMIQQVDTTGLEPDAGDQQNPESSQTRALRADVPVNSLARTEVLAEAPDPAPDAGLFRVPKVI
jgi:aspartyl-tRNA(Asn)/glutamyl-tRNA(Gln) amidotransferase subunit C